MFWFILLIEPEHVACFGTDASLFSPVKSGPAFYLIVIEALML